jgi:hypothetical protein
MRACVIAAVVLATGTARADDRGTLYDRLWPRLPLVPVERSRGTERDFGEQLEDQLTELGNQLGTHMNMLSKDRMIMRVDGRRRRAYIRLGSSSGNLTFRIANDIEFGGGAARVNTKIDLGIKHHVIRLELPDWEMAPASLNGDHGVELRLPLLRKTF